MGHVRGCPVLKRQQRPRDEVMAELPAESEASVQERIVAAILRAFGSASFGNPHGAWIGVNRAGHRGRGRVKASHGAGATDLTVVLDGVVTFAEVKRDERQKLSDAQVKKHAEMRRAGCYVVVWWEPGMAVRDIMERRERR